MLDEGLQLLAWRRARAAGVKDVDLSKGLPELDFDLGAYPAHFFLSVLPAARYFFVLSNSIFSAF